PRATSLREPPRRRGRHRAVVGRVTGGTPRWDARPRGGAGALPRGRSRARGGERRPCRARGARPPRGSAAVGGGAPRRRRGGALPRLDAALRAAHVGGGGRGGLSLGVAEIGRRRAGRAQEGGGGGARRGAG